MANFFGGVIPTFPITTNGAINSLTNGFIQELGGTAINVAISEVFPKNWLEAVGVSALEKPLDNLVQTTGRNLLRTGQQLVSETLSGGLFNSGAGAILGGIGENLAQSALSTLTQRALSSISGTPISLSQSSRWFPGAGSEPVADYPSGSNGISNYKLDPNGPDVTFSISPAGSGAVTQVTVDLFNPKSKIKLDLGKILPNSSGLPNYKFDPNTNIDSFIGGIYAGNDFTKIVGTPNFFEISAETQKLIEGDPNLFARSNTSGFSKVTLPVAWNFTCAPDNISWNSETQAEKISIFGTNQPPVVSGSKTMRDLTMSDALVEGFTFGRTVEDKIAELENLMAFSLDTVNRFVRVPVYYVKASNKKYGNGYGGVDGGYFIIKSVNVKEKMRDLKGNTTRATVDVTFTQVPGYQVSKGRDAANVKFLGEKSFLGIASQRQESFFNKVEQLEQPGRIGNSPPAVEPNGDPSRQRILNIDGSFNNP